MSNILTKNNISLMSKVKVNEIIASLLGYKVTGYISDAIYVSKLESGFTERLIDYCNSFSDLMSVAEDHIARIEIVNGMWVADSKPDGVYCHRFMHNDMKMAIACCLILVLQERQQ
jgi:hypothetical protein